MLSTGARRGSKSRSQIKDLSQVAQNRLRSIFKAFNRFMILLWRLGLGSWGNATKYGGYVMVLKHTGRLTGLTRLTPVNYAVIDDEIYCAAAFGTAADWYRNLRSIPEVEVWLPDGRWAGTAEDVSDIANRADILRHVIVASGFAGPLFGVNHAKLSVEDLETLLENYRLIRIRRTAAVTGSGGPGDLAWVWPISSLAFAWLLWRRGSRSRRSPRLPASPE